MCVYTPVELSWVQFFVTLCTLACPAPLPMEFSKQEYWSGLPFPPPGDLPDLGVEPCLLCLLHYRQILYPLTHWESLYICIDIYLCMYIGAQRVGVGSSGQRWRPEKLCGFECHNKRFEIQLEHHGVTQKLLKWQSGIERRNFITVMQDGCRLHLVRKNQSGRLN